MSLLKSKKKLLIVDDSKVTRMKIITELSSFGDFDIQEAEDGDNALIKIRNQKPDCMLLDILMPHKNGFSVLEELKNQNLSFPIIILTADIQKTTLKKCKELGAFDVLYKPINIKKMKNSIKRSLKQK